jgi:hypothetical protein
VLIGIGIVLGVLAVLIYSSMNLRQYRVEVCMAYQGQTDCRVASGTSREEAIRTAVQNACTLIASGMSNIRLCETSAPVSIKDLK